MNYLIIGCLTKIGINYINYFVPKEENNFVCIYEREMKKKYCALNSKVNKNLVGIHTKISIENIEEVLINHKIDKIINFYEYREGDYTKEQYTEVNYNFVVGLHKLCEKYNVKHLTQMSTVKVYGNYYHTFAEETSKPQATCDYTQSKIDSDEYLINQTTIPTAIIRVSEVFGKVYGNYFLDNLINSVLMDLDMVVNEDSDFIRSYIDVLDVTYSINAISMSDLTGVFNVCSNFFISAKDIIHLLLDKFELKEESVVYTKRTNVTIPCIKVENLHLTSTLEYKIENQEEKFRFFLSNIAYKKRLKEIDETLLM